MDHVGKVLDDRYRLLEILGEGGMGSVYLGQHTVIGREVAVKFLCSELTHDEDMVKRFYREAQAAAAIKHKSIIDVFDVGVAPWGEPYLVMEYLEGESLAAMIRRAAPMDLGAACAIMEPVLLALGAAHEKGIIHRDIKPDNIFIAHVPDGPPEVKLIDFGISKFTKGGESAELTQLTRTGELLGTPSYMAPEQARGETRVDKRTDLYAMGVVLYKMLTGDVPFQGENYNELLANILTTEAISPQEAHAGFPMEAEPIVLRAIEKNPEDRYQSAQEMLDDLKALQGFGQRQERFSEITDAVFDKTFASGDLGDAIPSSKGTGVAKDVLAKVVRSSSTPSRWSDSVAEKRTDRKSLWFGLAGFGAAVVLGAVVYFAVSAGEEAATAGDQAAAGGEAAAAGDEAAAVDQAAAEPAAPVVPKPAPQEKPSDAEPPAQVPDVLITVQGAPKEAEIFFDGRKVEGNPFRTKRSEGAALLEVKAPGFEAFKVILEPTDDKTVEAELKAITQAEAPQQTENKSQSKRDSQATEKKKAGKRRSGRTVKRDKTGTEFADDFE